MIAPPVRIDDSDLSPEAAADPAFAPRPIAEDPRILDPGDDRCEDEACSFDTIRALAEANRDTGQCATAIRTNACRHSMWGDLAIEDRLARMLVLGREFAARYDVDVRVFPCIAAVETRFLEPLMISEVHCSRLSTAQGLPQIIRPTFRLLYRGVGYRSTVVDDSAVDVADDDALDALFSSVGNSVRHQLELMAAVLDASGLDDSRSSYLNALINYNGGGHSIGYGYRVQACLQCLRDRVDIDGFEMRGDPVRCLEAAVGPGADLRRDFAGFRGMCEPE